mgnify:CR=1 FL=1
MSVYLIELASQIMNECFKREYNGWLGHHKPLNPNADFPAVQTNYPGERVSRYSIIEINSTPLLPTPRIGTLDSSHKPIA